MRRRSQPRVQRRKRRRTAPTSLRLRGVTGFPDNFYVTLQYVRTITFTTVFFDTLVWNANHLGDPEPLSGGHQPMFFDEYKALYDRWEVISTSYKMEIINSSPQPVHVCMFPHTILTPITNVSKGQEQPYSKHVMVGNLGQNKGRLASSHTTRQIRGERIVDDSFSGKQNLAPVRQWFYTTVVVSEPETIAVNVSIKFTMRYRTRFYKRLVSEQS